MKLNLDSIILYVQNVERLKDFYTTVLGLQLVEDDPPLWVLLQAGNSYIALHKIGNQYTGELKDGDKFHNNTKIVFKIEEDINELRQQLMAQHVSMREIKTFDNYPFWLCDGEDPEGNVFQLKQAK